jgi:hypothetical protein
MRILVLIIMLPIASFSQQNPVELGNVHWLRSYDDAIQKSKAESRPILILFQEIPGCQTCRSYGSDILTHPLLVEAIESEFIPLAIHNNKSGADGEVLKKYNEPSWNNPVVRVVDENGKDVVNRLNGNYSAAGLAAYITQAIIKSKGKAPAYLQLLADELTAQQKGTAKATYSMYCFWTGEALFGKVNGVVKTSAGFQTGKEAVVVEYDPALITISKLNEVAGHHQCNAVTGGNFKADNTPKYYLSNSKYKTVPMTELQKCRVNSALADGLDPAEYLSPRQLAYLEKTPVVNRVSMELTQAW